MTRINAGSTLANQYAPPFVVSNYVTTNWHLRWNANLLAFEAYDPAENVTEIGFDTIESQLFPGATNQQVFVLPWVAASKASLYATMNGMKIHTSEYTIFTDTLSNTTRVVLSDAYPGSNDFEFIGLQTTGGATIELATATADGVDTTLDLTWLAPSEQSLLITLDGIKQDTSAYSIAANATFTATTVTFVEAPSVSFAGLTSIAAQGTGYTALDLLTVGGGTGTSAATIRVDTIGGGGEVLTATLITGGVYSILPTNPVAVTGGTGANDATFTLTSVGQAIEVVGITTTGEVPASPVQIANLAGGTGAPGSPFPAGHARLFSAKTVSGETQIFSFRDLFAGTNITLTEGASSITIDAAQLALTQSGAGGSTLFDNNDPAAAVLKTVQAGDRIALSTTGTTPNEALVVTYNLGSKTIIQGTDADPYVQLAANRIMGLTNITGTQGVTLLAASALSAGDTITVKNQTAATDVITLTPAAGLIDGAASYVINTAYGYVTLYSDGSNYYIIAEG